MGSIGNTVSAPETFVGKSVTSLILQRGENENYQDFNNRERQFFNLPNATSKQLDTLRQIMRGINKYDKDYDDNKTPYNINNFTVEEIGGSASYKTPEEIERDRQLGIRPTKASIMVSIYTEPNTDSSYLRMADEKEHRVIIGPNGGLYTYNSKSNHTPVKLFDVQYGKYTYRS